MLRPLLCLPLCLLLTADRPTAISESRVAPEQVGVEALPETDPVAFLARCLEQYKARGVQGYTLTMQKQERINGQLQPSEEIEICFREQPHSVLMKWVKGHRLATRALYVEGANNNKVLAKPAGLASLLSVVEREPEGADAKNSGRYPLTQFGLRKTAERSLRSWKAAQDRGKLQFKYLGLVKVPEAGDRVCYALRRTCDPPEDDGQVETTLYIDKELGLQVGSIVKAAGDKLLGEYFYRNIKFNPEFKKGQFERAALNE